VGAGGDGAGVAAGDTMIRVLAAFMSLWLAASAALAQTSQFKGWAAISRELSTRIAPKDEPLDLGEFLPAEDMEDLLGTWSSFGTEHTFRNGVPNALNLMIWHVTLSGFANAVGETCTSDRLFFHPRFMKTLQQLCRWPLAAAKEEGVLLEFWTSVMGYNAGEDEYLVWKEFFLREYSDSKPAETVAAMTLAITMNPRFLLHR
jgi:hypothetical protein